MQILITEQHLNFLIENTQLTIFDDVTIPPGSVSYSFKTMTPWTNKYTGEVFVYFNGGEKIDGVLKTDVDDQLVFINLNGETFITKSGFFRYDTSKKSGSLSFNDLKRYNPGVQEILFPKKEITSGEIRESLQLAFPNNWKPRDNEFTAGLRGIYTIGDKIGGDEDWSIMNYFDTKKEIQQIINQYYVSSKKNTELKYWLVDELRNNDDFVKKLIDVQWNSIKSGFLTEKLTEKIIGTDNATFYPPGSIMDRENGVDMTYDGVNYQIKPLIFYDKEKNLVKTYGMKNYQNKGLVDKILFVNKNEMLEFDNKDYIPAFSSCEFSSPPTKHVFI